VLEVVAVDKLDVTPNDTDRLAPDIVVDSWRETNPSELAELIDIEETLSLVLDRSDSEDEATEVDPVDLEDRLDEDEASWTSVPSGISTGQRLHNLRGASQ
jgi:hypothetical protein